MEVNTTRNSGGLHVIPKIPSGNAVRSSAKVIRKRCKMLAKMMYISVLAKDSPGQLRLPEIEWLKVSPSTNGGGSRYYPWRKRQSFRS